MAHFTRIAALVVSAFVFTSCGVDRLGTDRARIALMFELDPLPPGYTGEAPRDDLGLFRLDVVGIFLGVRVTAPDMEDVMVDWPSEPVDDTVSQAELDFLVDAGENRQFDVFLLSMTESDGLHAFGGSRTVEDLPGGQRVDLEMELDEMTMVHTTQVVTVPDGVEDVVAVHPVDARFLVVYPAATHVAEGSDLRVTDAQVVSGRHLGWALKLGTGDWTLSDTVTEVP